MTSTEFVRLQPYWKCVTDKSSSVTVNHGWYLKRPVVPESPHARRHWDGRDEEERHEDQEPEVWTPLHTVTHQHLEGEQEEVDSHSDQHGLKLHAGLTLSPKDDISLYDMTKITLP